MNTARFLKTLLAVGAIVACLCGIVACSGNKGDSASGGTAATVNGVDIPEEKVTKEVEHVRSQSGLTDDEQWGKFLVQNDMTPESVRSEIIDTMIEKELIKKGAADLGVSVESSEVDEAISSFKENFSSDEAWQKALEQAGFTSESYRENIEESMIEKKVGEHFEGQAEVTDEDYVSSLKTYASYYDGAKRIAQIVFTESGSDSSANTGDDAEAGKSGESASSESAASSEASGEAASSEASASGESASDESASSSSASSEASSESSSSSASSEASPSEGSSSGASAESASAAAGADATSAAKAQADGVLAQINSGALDFADAARQFSTDKSTSENGGEMGWDKLLTLEDDYTNALTNLEEGQVSEVIEASDGSVFILKVLEVYHAPAADSITSLDQIPEAFRQNIKDMALSVKANSLYTEWLDGLKESADKKTNDMPSNLPYAIDLKPYEDEKKATEAAEAESGAAEDASATTTEGTDATATTDAAATDAAATDAATAPAQGDAAAPADAAATGSAASADATAASGNASATNSASAESASSGASSNAS